jgi:hypothetical protein
VRGSRRRSASLAGLDDHHPGVYLGTSATGRLITFGRIGLYDDNGNAGGELKLAAGTAVGSLFVSDGGQYVDAGRPDRG